MENYEEVKPKKNIRQERRLNYRVDEGQREFKNLLKSYLATTRFSNETWRENQDYLNKQNGLKCVYAACEQINSQIPQDAPLFILEMNNEENRIMGVGMVRNRVYIRKHLIYTNQEYNRYAYTGKHRIDRKEMNEEEERIMKAFDMLCFRGSRHMKRLRGIKIFPIDMLYRCKKVFDIDAFIKNMFTKRLFKESVY